MKEGSQDVLSLRIVDNKSHLYLVSMYCRGNLEKTKKSIFYTLMAIMKFHTLSKRILNFLRKLLFSLTTLQKYFQLFFLHNFYLQGDSLKLLNCLDFKCNNFRGRPCKFFYTYFSSLSFYTRDRTI